MDGSTAKFIKEVVDAEFKTHAKILYDDFNRVTEKMKKDFEKTNSDNMWTRTNAERHAILVEEYMANMNEILKERL